MDNKKPAIKILHVFGRMNRGGAENWIMQVMRNIDKERFNFDFLVHNQAPGDFDNEIRACGSKVLYCANYNNIIKYYFNFKRIIKENGPYQIIHSHVHHFSGFIFLIAHLLKIPVLIAHSHSDTSSIQDNFSLSRKLYYSLSTFLIKKYANLGIACSEKAAKSLFGNHWASNIKFVLSFTGIDLAPFKKNIDKNNFRTENKFPNDGFIIGHVGNFVEPKNHKFLINIFKAVTEQDANIYLLLAGEGPLKAEIINLVNNYQLSNKVIFAGSRNDIPDLMLAGMDLFVLPSIFEGLPLVGMEAQAAGLKCLFSDKISNEVHIYPPNTIKLPIDQGLNIWKEEILKQKQVQTNLLDRSVAFRAVEESPFNINKSILALTNFYFQLISNSSQINGTF